MNSQLIVILLVGLAASTYALDLSHAKKRSIEEEMDPRALSFIKDLYAQVIYPSLNHVVTSLALLGAQVLAGVSETGIPAPGGRTSFPSDAQARNIFENLWHGVLRPHLEQALSGVALSAAGLLAGIGTNGIDLSIGKRDLDEAEMRGLDDILSQAFNSVFHNVFKKPMEEALSSGALMLAQVLAGIGTNGVDLSNMIGKRDLSEFAGRQDELRGFFDTLGQGLLNGLQSVWTNIAQKPIQDALQTTALLGAQVLAGIGVNGVDLSAIMGKRDIEAEGRGIFDDLVGHAGMLISTQVKPTLEGLINNAILNLAGVLANFSQGQIGRR